MKIKERKDTEILHEKFSDDGSIPNNPEAGAIIYQGVLQFEGPDGAAEVESLFSTNGWSNSWRNGIYNYHHYHSNTQEVLGVYGGEVNIQLGGVQGKSFKLKKGDVVIIPAGVAHKNLGDSGAFACVGAYPGGKSWDMNKGSEEERENALEKIKQVPAPEKDPVFGEEGPVFEYWR